MKKYLALGLLTSLLLTSCSVDWNDEKAKKIGELEKQVIEMRGNEEGDIFKKKQECAKYITMIEDKIKKDEKELNTEWDYYHETLDEIFYSKTKKTCIGIWRSNWIMKWKWWDLQETRRIIYDVLSNDKTNYDQNDKNSILNYYEEVKNLKAN